MTEGEKKRPGLGGEVREGIRAGIGILAAMKDAIEETIQDLVDGGREGGGPEGDAGPTKPGAAAENQAKAAGDPVAEAVDAAKERAREAGRQAAERLEVVTREELDSLRSEVAELRERVRALEGGPSSVSGA